MNVMPTYIYILIMYHVYYYHAHMTVLACLGIIHIHSSLLVQDTYSQLNILILAWHMLLQRGPDDQKMANFILAFEVLHFIYQC